MAEISAVQKQYGYNRLPSNTELRRIGRYDLINAIRKYHGGFFAVRTLLQEHNERVAHGTWQSRAYAIQQARSAMDANGWKSLPEMKTLVKAGYSSLAVAITKYHGGFRAIRKDLGEQPDKVEPGMWKSLDYTLQQALSLLRKRKLATLPSASIIQTWDSSLFGAIARYHGGFPAFRMKLNAHLGINPEKKEIEDLIDGYDSD